MRRARSLISLAAGVARAPARHAASGSGNVAAESTLAEGMRQLQNLRVTLASAIAERKPAFDQMFGITTHVAKAHDSIQTAEERFCQAQQAHRTALSDLADVQQRLKELHAQLDRTSRGDAKYLQLLRLEHEAVTKERQLMQIVQSKQTAEMRDYAQFAALLRQSQTDELRRAQHIRKLTLAGAAAGFTIGALLALGLRRRPVASAAADVDTGLPSLMVVTTPGAGSANLMPSPTHPAGQLSEQLSSVVVALQGQIAEFVASLSSIVSLQPVVELPQLHIAGGDDARGRAQIALHRDMNGVLKGFAAERGYTMAHDGDALILDESMPRLTPGMSQVDPETARFKLRTLIYVVAVYAAFALTAPLVYGILKG